MNSLTIAYTGWSLFITFILMWIVWKNVFLVRQDEVFRRIEKIICFSEAALLFIYIGLTVLCRDFALLELSEDITVRGTIGVVMLSLPVIVSTAITCRRRKRRKWFGLFTVLSMLGYVQGFTGVCEFILAFLFGNAAGEHVLIQIAQSNEDWAGLYGPVVLIIYFIVFSRRFSIRKRLQEYADFELETGEELAIYGIGIWLFIETETLSSTVYYDLSTLSTPSIMIAVTNFIIALFGPIMVYMSCKQRVYADRSEMLQTKLITVMADLVESRDLDTGGHIQRTAAYSAAIAEQLKAAGRFTDILTDDYIKDMAIAAPLHDVGKIHVPDAILNKPGRFNDEEFAIMKEHAAYGSYIIDRVITEVGETEYLQTAREMARWHHEWWNGQGYPDGISGEEIPLCARILAVADVFDALVSKRIYKNPMPLDKAYGILKEESGTHFDPEIVEAFFAAVECGEIVIGEGRME